MRALLITCYLTMAGFASFAGDRLPIEVDPAQFVKSDRDSATTRRLIASEVADFFRTSDTPRGIQITILQPETAKDEDVDDLARRIAPITLALQRCKDLKVELHEHTAEGTSLRASLVRDAMIANGVPADKITMAAQIMKADVKPPSVDVLVEGDSIRPPASTNAASVSVVISTGN